MSSGVRPRVLILPGGPGLSPSYLRPYLDRIFAEHECLYVDHSSSKTLSEVKGKVKKAFSHAALTEKDCVFAHSWGSWLTFEVLQNQESSPAFVFANPVPLTSSGFDVIAERLKSRVTPAQHVRLSRVSAGKDIMKILLRSYCGHTGRLPKLSFEYWPERERNIAAEISDYDHTPLFETVRSRSLLLFGATDHITPKDFGGSTQHMWLMPKGHFGFAEAEKDYRRAILSFLGAPPSR